MYGHAQLFSCCAQPKVPRHFLCLLHDIKSGHSAEAVFFSPLIPGKVSSVGTCATFAFAHINALVVNPHCTAVIPGRSCFFEPHGAKMHHNLLKFVRAQNAHRGYDEVITPNIFNFDLWRTSGHADHYADDMFQVNSLFEHLCPQMLVHNNLSVFFFCRG